MYSICAAATQEPFFCLDHIVYVSYKKIHSQGLLWMSLCLESVVRSDNNNKRKTNNNCTVLGRREKSERLLSPSMSAIIRKRGAEKQRNMSRCSFGVELEPQSLILKWVRGLCDVVCSCVCSWMGGTGLQLYVCLHAFTHKYDASYNKKTAIIHFKGPVFALHNREAGRDRKHMHVYTSWPCDTQLS